MRYLIEHDVDGTEDKHVGNLPEPETTTVPLTDILQPMLALQGEIRLQLIAAGIPVDKSLLLSGDILDNVVTSEVVRPEFAEAYRQLAEGE